MLDASPSSALPAMNALQPRPRLSPADYLAWEATQSVRHEFVDGEVYAMTGARLAHNVIALNAAAFLRTQLRGTPCRVYMSDVKLQVEAADAWLYPDVMVSCEARDRVSDRELAVRWPWLVVEVLSDSSAGYDRGAKFALYRRVPTLTHYLLVEQEQPRADLYVRNAEGLWVLHPLAAADVMRLPERGLEWPVAALFDDVDFDTADAAPTSRPLPPP